MNTTTFAKPTSAFVGLSYLVLGAGMIAFCIGLWNAGMQLNEKGFYFTVQKNTRDIEAARGDGGLIAPSLAGEFTDRGIAVC